MQISGGVLTQTECSKLQSCLLRSYEDVSRTQALIENVLHELAVPYIPVQSCLKQIHCQHRRCFVRNELLSHS